MLDKLNAKFVTVIPSPLWLFILQFLLFRSGQLRAKLVSKSLFRLFQSVSPAQLIGQPTGIFASETGGAVARSLGFTIACIAVL